MVNIKVLFILVGLLLANSFNLSAQKAIITFGTQEIKLANPFNLNVQENKVAKDVKKPPLVEIKESLGYRDPFENIEYNFDMLPTAEIAFKVALPMLKAVYKDAVDNCAFFETYLTKDSLWVIHGRELSVDGGYPYIELDRHSGRVVKIVRTPVYSIVKEKERKADSGTPKNYIVPEWMGYRYDGKENDLDRIDVLPTIEVAYEVALTLLEVFFQKLIYKFPGYDGFLASDNVWVFNGQMPRPLREGGTPYIELDKHTGAVVKIFHSK